MSEKVGLPLDILQNCLYNINEDLSWVDPRRMKSKFTKSGSSKTQPQIKEQSRCVMAYKLRTKSQQKGVHFSCNKYLGSRIPFSKQKLLNFAKSKTQKWRVNLGIPLKRNENMAQFTRSALKSRYGTLPLAHPDITMPGLTREGLILSIANLWTWNYTCFRRQRALTQDRTPCTNATACPGQVCLVLTSLEAIYSYHRLHSQGILVQNQKPKLSFYVIFRV